MDGPCSICTTLNPIPAILIGNRTVGLGEPVLLDGENCGGMNKCEGQVLVQACDQAEANGIRHVECGVEASRDSR